MNIPAQLTLDIPEPVKRDGQKVWVLASEGADIPTGGRLLLADSDFARPVVGPDDLVLVRTAPGHHSVYVPMHVPHDEYEQVADRVTSRLLGSCGGVRRVSDVIEMTGIAPSRGRWRGRLANQDSDVRSRTDFEHALVRVASRKGIRGSANALRAIGIEETIPDDAVHPMVRGVFQREKGDLLNCLFLDGGADGLAQAAIPAYREAATSFVEVGLHRQAWAALKCAKRLERSLEEPWLPGLPLPTELAKAALGLGYTINRMCGFAIGIDGDRFWAAPAKSKLGALQQAGKIQVPDEAFLDMLAGTRPRRQRAIAKVHCDGTQLLVQAGLSGEMHAYLGSVAGEADYSDVTAIMIESQTLDVTGEAFWHRPRGPVTFETQPSDKSQDVSLRIAMARGDDLLLRFKIQPGDGAARTFI